MARFDGGWVKAWRKVAGSDLVENVWVWGLWHWLLYSAAYKPSKAMVGGKQVEIKPGMVVFGLKELAEKWGCSKTTIRKWVNYLRDTQRIAVESRAGGYIVTIQNWDLYQSYDDQVLTPGVREVNATCTEGVREVTLSEEGKKERREEGSSSVAVETAPTAEVWEAYREAYKARHGADPTRNKTVNSQLKGFTNRVPAGEAAEIAAFYVRHNDQFYVRNLHPVGLLLKDAEKLRTEWLTGRTMTGAQAKMTEKGDYHRQQMQRILDGKV